MQDNKEILIAKYLSGNASPAEEKKLTEWLRQNPANQQQFDRSAELWHASSDLKKNKEADVDAAWSEFRSLTQAQPEIRLKRINYGWMKVAAALALFVVTTVVIKLFFTDSPKTSPVAEQKRTEAAPVVKKEEPPVEIIMEEDSMIQDSVIPEAAPVKPQTRRSKTGTFPMNAGVAMVTILARDSAEIFQLPDHSIVYLNANSKLEYPQNFSKTNRRVTLTGEAYFDVKKDSGQFEVYCENTLTKGKATAFNVKSHPADRNVEVIVANGSVEFSGIGYRDFKKLVLTTGESGVYNKQKSTIVKSKHHSKDYQWWEKNNLRARIKAFFDKLLGRKKQN